MDNTTQFDIATAIKQKIAMTLEDQKNYQRQIDLANMQIKQNKWACGMCQKYIAALRKMLETVEENGENKDGDSSELQPGWYDMNGVLVEPASKEDFEMIDRHNENEEDAR